MLDAGHRLQSPPAVSTRGCFTSSWFLTLCFQECLPRAAHSACTGEDDGFASVRYKSVSREILSQELNSSYLQDWHRSTSSECLCLRCLKALYTEQLTGSTGSQHCRSFPSPWAGMLGPADGAGSRAPGYIPGQPLPSHTQGACIQRRAQESLLKSLQSINK